MASDDVDLLDTTTAYGVPMSRENAALVLAAAEDLGVSPEVVRTTDGGFSGPKAVIHKAFPDVKSADAARDKAKRDDEPDGGVRELSPEETANPVDTAPNTSRKGR